MACCQHLLAISFHHANAPSISRPKFAPKLYFNWPSRTNIENKALITCSAIGHDMRASSDHHIGGLHTHPAGRTSDVLRLIDETEEGLFSTGKFGRFGGMFVPETLIYSLNKLLAEFIFCLRDPEFQGELAVALRDYVGRETPLYFAQRLTDHYKNSNGEGPEIYLKREDLNHGGAHKINNAIAQAMLAKRMGLKRVVAATGAGGHGVATAAACAKLSLDCSICMGKLDEERQPYNVLLMKHLGAQSELAVALRDYVGRETPLYFAQRLTDHYKNSNGEGPEIYLKREDLNHGGAHKINNAIAQAMLAKRMGRKSVVAATGAGQHGVATAAACAKLSLDCSIFMGNVDEERQSSNVLLMKHLGAQVKSVEGTFKDATSEAIRNWVEDLDNSCYLAGTAVGPHPCPISESFSR
ncbi:UNVERIFIED_CONTAM: Tryptophan synthase beta chain 1, chloroplastic [Sesamum latifolium]|uniref:tryptophan synthase n=1 Tax=Sesamum latifolium TaxID=2727402 RepID=A0AAW2WS36_9LAMI